MSTPGQGPGRPRDDRIDERVITVTRELLGEVGFSALAVDEVARRAGVGKAAIYRRYGSKAELAFAATIHGRTLEPTTDTGSLHGDLLDLARESHRLMSSPAAVELAPAFIEALGGDNALLERFRTTIVAAEINDITSILERAVARGELDRVTDPAVLHLQVLGPIFAGVLGFRVSVDDAMICDLVAITCAGLISTTVDRGTSARG